MKKDNPKIILILVGLGLILFSVLMVYLIINPAPPSAPVTGKISPTVFKFIQPTVPVVIGERIKVSDVMVKNFYKVALKSNKSGDLLLAQTADHLIVYIPKDSYFLISILNTNFDVAREVAELRLIEILDIDKEGACRLKVTVTTPVRINPSLNGPILPLS